MIYVAIILAVLCFANCFRLVYRISQERDEVRRHKWRV